MRRGADLFNKAQKKADKKRGIMGRNSELHIIIYPEIFKDELWCRGISIASLGDPESYNYIGVSAKTIYRGLKNGYFTKRTVEALANVIETDIFIKDYDYDDLENLHKRIQELESENKKLRKMNQKLHARIKELLSNGYCV